MSTRHKVHNNKQRIKEKINKLKKGKKCLHCGESHQACLEFHHVITDEKVNEICNMFTRYTEEEIMEEIKKCIIVCANCHRKIHWRNF
jgi:hypothetical protein